MKRARQDDGLDGGDRRLSVIQKIEEDGTGHRQRGLIHINGEYACEGNGGKEDRDVEMEDVELTGIERELERGLWTYHGGNSMLR